ncbi:MAG: MCE family protein [Brevinematales bacterium]|nr:MCE family protein [Brevinematales bacterium]
MPFTFKAAQKAVASFIVIAIFILITFLILIGKSSDLFERKSSYYTFLNKGYGLQPGTAVKYKDFTIGKITAIDLLDDDMIRLDLIVYEKYQRLMEKDCVIKVASGLLGGASLELMTLSDSNPTNNLLSGSLLLSSDMPEGQTMMTQYMTVPSGGPEELMVKVGDVLDMVNNMGPVLYTTLLNVRDMSLSFKEIMGGLAGTDKALVSDKLIGILDDVKSMTYGLKGIMQEIDQKKNSIGALIYDNKKLFNYIDSMAYNADQTMKKIDGMMSDFKGMPSDLKKVILLLKEDMIELKKVMENLPFGMGSKSGKKEEPDTSIIGGDRE